MIGCKTWALFSYGKNMLLNGSRSVHIRKTCALCLEPWIQSFLIWTSLLVNNIMIMFI